MVYVRDIRRYVRIGETVKVKIIDYDPKTEQARLSLKALQRPHARIHRRQTIRQKATLPSMRLGFSSISSHMDQWIKEAEEEILK
jgi:predicted RNA-binding protein with RPS1 domain